MGIRKRDRNRIAHATKCCVGYLLMKKKMNAILQYGRFDSIVIGGNGVFEVKYGTFSMSRMRAKNVEMIRFLLI